MRTLSYIKVAVFALTIGMVTYAGSKIYQHGFTLASAAHAGEFKVVNYPALSPTKVDEYWLALNMYYEAATEPRIGKIAVGIVTLNRVNDTRYPKTVKDVVTENKQFSWYNSKVVKPPANKEIWQECLDIARMLLTKKIDSDIINILEGATHYHTTKVNPPWAKTKTKIVQIGEHIFYRFEKI